MLLRDVTAGIPGFFQPCDQGGFSGTTRSNNTNQRSGTWRLHIISCSSDVPEIRNVASMIDDLLIRLHQAAQLLGPAEYGKRIARMQRPRIGGVHF